MSLGTEKFFLLVFDLALKRFRKS